MIEGALKINGLESMKPLDKRIQKSEIEVNPDFVTTGQTKR